MLDRLWLACSDNDGSTVYNSTLARAGAAGACYMAYYCKDYPFMGSKNGNEILPWLQIGRAHWADYRIYEGRRQHNLPGITISAYYHSIRWTGKEKKEAYQTSRFLEHTTIGFTNPTTASVGSGVHSDKLEPRS